MRNLNAKGLSVPRGIATAVACAFLTAAFSTNALAGPAEQAQRIYNRIAGVPPSAAELQQMVQDIQSNDPIAAANVALQSPAFYNTVLKNWAMPWTNRDQ